MDAVRTTARRLRSEAAATNERRMLVLHGGREACYRGAATVADVIGVDRAIATVSERDIVGERIGTDRTETLLGTTCDCLVLDCHDTCRPNAIGRVTGAVDGGGVLVILCPTLSEWESIRGQFDESLAPPPFSVSDVTRRLRRHLIQTLRSHRGVSIVDADAGVVTKESDAGSRPRPGPQPVSRPDSHAFPGDVYDACRTGDQRDAVHTCESLIEEGSAVVLEADRGRGKSSAAGFAAAAFALDGASVLVTAPAYRNAAALFERAAEVLRSMGELDADERDGNAQPSLRTGDGSIRFRRPSEAVDASADVLFVDEAAAIPVNRLTQLLSSAPSVCLSTTVRGYEGAGRGFDVRFRETLDASHDVTECFLSEPIRYAPSDPIEAWLFHALFLGSAPPPDQLVEGAAPEDVAYERIDREHLARNEALLREVFGLLVYAHYRTQPDDLARILDGPEVELRALTVGGHPVSVAVLAREGGLSEETRRTAYEGDRIRGNLIPDLLTSQLRDPEAGEPTGYRVVRIVTHHAVRSGGFGSRLLGEIETEFGDSSPTAGNGSDCVDYLGVSYGATPQLLRFWAANGYRTVHLSTTRNDASGEHSAVMIRPLSTVGDELTERHSEWFYRRVPGVLSGSLGSIDPDVVRESLAAVDTHTAVELSDFEWRLVASAAYGPGMYDTAPDPFRRLALVALVDGTLEDRDAERLLVVRVLQNDTWENTATRLEYVSQREAKRALGDAYRPIVDRYGTETAKREADRYRST